MSQHTKQSKENGGRIPFQPFSIASRSHYKTSKYAPEVPKPRVTHVLNLRTKTGFPMYRQVPSGQILS